MKKTKLPTFISSNAQVKVQYNWITLNNQYLILKEQKLMSRFFIAAKSRPDIDLPGYFGTYEFLKFP